MYEEGLPANDLWANSLQALYEFNPLEKDELLYRKQKFGKHLEIFFPDFRSYRSPNADNDKDELAAMMGQEQLQWLKDGLKESTATWKIISSHDPLGVVTGGDGDRDSFGQEDVNIKGRELELKDLLGFIHDEDITGVVSLTSDVHYTAYVNMSPEKAEGGWDQFKPLDEFVIGPIHAGETKQTLASSLLIVPPVFKMYLTHVDCLFIFTFHQDPSAQTLSTLHLGQIMSTKWDH